MRYVSALFLFVCGLALAQTVYEARTADGVVVTLHDAPCALKNEISNLPYRATWSEKGRVFEGCFAVNPHAGVVVFFFSGDKTVAIVPIGEFTKGTVL